MIGTGLGGIVVVGKEENIDNEQQYRQLIELSPLAIAIHCEGSLRYVNPVCVQLFAIRSADQVIGKPVMDFVHPDSRETVSQRIRSVYEHGESGGITQERLLRGDGSVLDAEVAVAPCSFGGKPAAQVVLRDISERVRAERVIRELNQSLERRVAERTTQLAAANKELQTFAYSVSHDLRSPLHHIGGFAEALADELGEHLNANARRYLDRIRDGVDQMADLINVILELSRLAHVPLVRVDIDLPRMARTVVDDLRAGYAETDFVFEIKTDVHVQGDANFVRQLLENLLSNALKFSQTQKHPQIELGSNQQQADDVVFHVRDNGVGFEPAQADRMFAPFQRLHRPDEFEGHGVGLATAQRIVSRHGGRIWAESTPGQGATVFFTLPRSPSS